MKKIHKCRIRENNLEVYIAAGTQPLFFEVQDDLWTVWYEVHEKKYLNTSCSFQVIGTGQTVPGTSATPWTHLNSTIDRDNALVWHCYYKLDQ